MDNSQEMIKRFKKLFNKTDFKKYWRVGQLANIDFNGYFNKGDEVDILNPLLKNIFDYDEECIEQSKIIQSCKLRIDRGKAFHFELSQSDEDKILFGENIDNFTESAIRQFTYAIDCAFANLYTRAGHYLDNNGKALNLTPEIAKDILAYMCAKFQRGDGKGHTNWFDGRMTCVIPPEYQFYLGDVKNLCGWDIVVSSAIAQPEKKVFYPLFGVKDCTLVGAISELQMSSYIPEKSFNTCYKGYALYGVGASNSEYLGTVKVRADIGIGEY